MGFLSSTGSEEFLYIPIVFLSLQFFVFLVHNFWYREVVAKNINIENFEGIKNSCFKAYTLNTIWYVFSLLSIYFISYPVFLSILTLFIVIKSEVYILFRKLLSITYNAYELIYHDRQT